MRKLRAVVEVEAEIIEIGDIKMKRNIKNTDMIIQDLDQDLGKGKKEYMLKKDLKINCLIKIKWSKKGKKKKKNGN